MIEASRAIFVALALTVAVTACSEEDPVAESDLQSELNRLRDQIESAESTAVSHRNGLLGKIAARRREVLLLSAAMLENRIIAEQGGVPTEVVAVTSTPDPARAEQLLRHIAAAKEELEKVEDAASQRDGMASNLSQAAIATLELTIAQLHQAYYEAAYGLALPEPGEVVPADAEDPPLATSAPPVSNAPTTTTGKTEDPAAPETVAQTAAPQVAAIPPPKEAEKPSEPRVYGKDDYVRIQKLLKQAGYDPGPVDGQWGPRTKRALSDFQKSAGLPPTGEPDPVSMEALGFD